MRVFTDLEKGLLRRMNTWQGRNLYGLIDPWIKGVSFQINSGTNSVDLIFDNTYLGNNQSLLVERLEEIQLLLIQSVNLIKLFEDKGYIFTYSISKNIPNPFTFGQAAVNSPSITYQFPDNRISELFIKYATNEIFVTPELGKFISDNFITREELRANRQYNGTLWAIKVSAFGIFLTLIFNVYNTFIKKEKPKEVIIIEKPE
jgi:hypothetical protein